mgnify:CR=1 FL=1
MVTTGSSRAPRLPWLVWRITADSRRAIMWALRKSVSANTIVTAPRPSPIGRGGSSYSLGTSWVAGSKFNPSLPPSAYGMVDFRYFNRAATAMFDGHVEPQTPDQLRDMRKWSNFANRPDWNFTPAP